MELVFKIFVVFTIIQRLIELLISSKNINNALANGAFVVKEPNYIFMVLLHTSWLVILLNGAFFNDIEFHKHFFYIGIALFIVGQVFRIITIKTLGKRWSTKIVIWKNKKSINNGIFKYFRHPNYIGVVLEIFALPLIASMIGTSLIFTIINGLILFLRIRTEESYLKKFNEYEVAFDMDN